jgi:hypothetical protein
VWIEELKLNDMIQMGRILDTESPRESWRLFGLSQAATAVAPTAGLAAVP